jgi:tRNA uridine 5-carboxymethylaminomethyl modification enzyme
LGLADAYRYELLREKQQARDALIAFLESYSVKPSQVNDALIRLGTEPLAHGCKLVDLLARPQLTLRNLSVQLPALSGEMDKVSLSRRDEILEAVEVAIKYRGYIRRERQIADKINRLENIFISGKFDYDAIQSLSTEARQKLNRIKPETIAQASRIPGISPSDINILLVLLGR